MKYILIAILVFNSSNFSYAQISASQMQRTQDSLDKERVLREKIDKGEKVYIKNISVKGISLLTEEQINKVVFPFKRHWLTEADIQQILKLIKQAYKEKGYPEKPARFTFEVKKKCLEITVEEEAPK